MNKPSAAKEIAGAAVSYDHVYNDGWDYCYEIIATATLGFVKAFYSALFPSGSKRRLFSVTDPAGNTKYYHYDADSNVNLITDSEGNKVEEYSYENGKVSRWIKYNPETGEAIEDYSYEYYGDNTSRVTNEITGEISGQSYDGRGRITSVWTQQGEEGVRQIQAVYQYDNEGHTIYDKGGKIYRYNNIYLYCIL